MAVYACSDIHGCIDFYKAIKNYIKPEDKVYFLGDAGDRGPEPWETIKAVLCDPQFVYIKGNHEDMLIDAIRDALEGDNMYMYSYRLLASNGGADTLDQAMLEQNPAMWMRQLKTLPTFEKYVNTEGEIIYLSHAGFTPWYADNESFDIRIPVNRELIWNRDHFLDDFDAIEWAPITIVHGHTPIPYLWEDLRVPEEDQEKGALWYANGSKLCIDTGAVWTGHCVLVNLDTWDEEIFEI